MIITLVCAIIIKHTTKLVKNIIHFLRDAKVYSQANDDKQYEQYLTDLETILNFNDICLPHEKDLS